MKHVTVFHTEMPHVYLFLPVTAEMPAGWYHTTTM